MKQKLIAVDDDPIIRELVKAAFANTDIDVVLASSGMEALTLFLEDPTLVILSDLSMPEMTGSEFVQKVLDLGHKPIFIILTSETDAKTVVELFKKGVHDYIIKPFSPPELVNRVQKAFEFAELSILNQNIQKERDIRVEHQLNWNLFKENIIKRENDKVESGLMSSIKTNLMQGAGIGAMVPVASMIRSESKLEKDHYIVQKELLDILLDNMEITKKLISVVQDTDFVINHTLPKEKLRINEIHEIIKMVISENADYIKINNHQVKLSENKFNNVPRLIEINVEYFQKVIKELLINAFKFSDHNTKIYVLLEILGENLQISFLNPPQKNSEQADGIPPEYHNILFEPFFRLSRYVFEPYETLDYGMGLCFAEKIIRNHKGKVRISNLKSFLDDGQSLLINFMIELPFLT